MDKLKEEYEAYVSNKAYEEDLECMDIDNEPNSKDQDMRVLPHQGFPGFGRDDEDDTDMRRMGNKDVDFRAQHRTDTDMRHSKDEDLRNMPFKRDKPFRKSR